MKTHWQTIYQTLFQPRAQDEDTKRREFIFSVLLFGALMLTSVAFLSMAINSATEGASYDGLPPITMVGPIAFLTVLYCLSRRHFRNVLPYIFVLLFVGLATYSLFVYGYAQADGLLAYGLVIVMAAIVISVRAAVFVTGLITVCLFGLAYVQLQGISHPDLSKFNEPLSVSDVVVYVFIFIVILLVSWLSNRDIERSLTRARISEGELILERNSLEVKVRQRTRQLEQAQVEKMMQLHRFAEFGRLSSTLLHELANPLTSVSLELEQLASTEHSSLVAQARVGIAHMEEYVTAARKQLQNQSAEKVFDSSEEIKRVIEFLEPRAKSNQVFIRAELDDKVRLYGDSIRFNQIIANLTANAIDAYGNKRVRAKQSKTVMVQSMRRGKYLEILVTDHGIGIQNAELRRIFDPFFTTKTHERGMGLGLSITKQSVEEAFKGTIQVKSSKQSGTQFIVKIPLYDEDS